MRKLVNRLLALLQRTRASIRASRASLVEGSQNLDRRAP